MSNELLNDAGIWLLVMQYRDSVDDERETHEAYVKAEAAYNKAWAILDRARR